MNTYVAWSDRYQQWTLVNGVGHQVFTESGHPLVYTDKADAYAMTRLIWAGTVASVVTQ